MKAVFIATPTYDEWVCMEYASSLFETGIRLADAGYGCYHCVNPGNPFLDLARNTLVAKFLMTDAEDLLFIDADVGWDSKVVTRILSYPQEVVGGLVPKRDAKSEGVFHQNAITGVMSPEGLFQCKEIPTAFLRIKRSAFEKLKEPYFKTGSAPGDFGEDIYFCRRWCETGEFLWIDSDINFSHRGGKAWKGNFFEHCIKTGALVQPDTTPMSMAA
jgi:hypothetical protein